MSSSSAKEEEVSPRRPRSQNRRRKGDRSKLASRPNVSATSITPLLKLSSFDEDIRAHIKPQLPNPTDVVLVPIPVLPKVSNQARYLHACLFTNFVNMFLR